MRPSLRSFNSCERTDEPVSFMARPKFLHPGKPSRAVKEATRGAGWQGSPVSVAYVRVSSSSQSTDLQKTVIQRAATLRGDDIGMWFDEKGSGKTVADREGLQALRRAVRGGFVARLYLYRIDRLTRSGIRDTLGLIEEFRRAGVEVISCADGFALDGPGSDVVLAVLGWAAQMERLAIGERISSAHRRAKEQGLPWGRPRRVDRQTAELLTLAHAAGVSVRKLAMAHKIPRTTVSRVLSQKPTPKPSPKLREKKGRDRGAAR